MKARLLVFSLVLALTLIGVVNAFPGTRAVATLKILQAWYGAGSGRGRDVTSIVAAALSEGRRSIPANNATFTDTASGEHKQLVVKYSIDGKEGSVSVLENNDLVFSSLGPIANSPGVSTGNANTIIVPVDAAGLDYNAQLRKLYATVGDKGQGSMANSLLQIDPLTGKIERTVYIGSDPANLVVGAQGKTVFVAFGGGHSVVPVDTTSFTVGAPLQLGPGTVMNLYDMSGVPNGVIVELKVGDYDYRLIPFADGKPTAEGGHCHLQTVPAINHQRFYTFESQLSPSSSNQMLVLPNLSYETRPSPPQWQGNIGLGGSVCGLALNDQGVVFDPETSQVFGSLKLGFGSVLATDSLRPQVYCVEGGDRGHSKLAIYSLADFAKVGDAEIGGDVSGGARRLLRWGESGIAFLQSDKIVCSRLNLGPVANVVDLSVARSKPSTEFEHGASVSYTLTATNRSEKDSSPATITETLPEGVSVQSATSSQGDVSIHDSYVSVAAGVIPAHKTVTVQIRVMVGNLRDLTFVGVVRSLDTDPDTTNNLALPFGIEALSNVVARAAGPDLTIKLEGVSQRSEGAGVGLKSHIVGTVTINNAGNRASQKCLVRYYLEDGPRLYLPEALLVQELEIGSIEAGGTMTLNLDIPLGHDDVTGTWFIGAVDPTHLTTDIDPRNNEASSRI
jgi:uncharacterized repeat protein (TIGR01451 family)